MSGGQRARNIWIPVTQSYFRGNRYIYIYKVHNVPLQRKNLHTCVYTDALTELLTVASQKRCQNLTPVLNYGGQSVSLIRNLFFSAFLTPPFFPAVFPATLYQLLISELFPSTFSVSVHPSFS